MNNKKRLLFGLAFAGTFFASFTMRAQFDVGASAGIDAAVMQALFGKNTAFTAEAHVNLPSGGQTSSLVMNMAHLDGNMRMDMDMAQMKGPMFQPQLIEQMKAAGMDKVSTIMRPDKKTTMFIYPGLQAYLEMPLPEEQVQALEKGADVRTVEQGRESVDGHSTVKKLVTIQHGGDKKEVTVWNAVRLNDFPVQIELVEAGETVTMRFRNINFAKPAVGRFEPPKEFKHYQDMQELQKLMIQRMMGDLAP